MKLPRNGSRPVPRPTGTSAQPVGLRPVVSAAVCLCLLALCAPAPPVAAEDWPQWRGPRRDGVSTETGLADRWPAGGPPLLWRIDGLGEGFGAVAVVDGLLYVQGTRGGRSLVFALDAPDGSVRWERELGPRLRDSRGNGPRGTPTVAGDSLYALTGTGELARIRLADGRVAWRRNILRDFDQRNISWGISESPLVEGDSVVVMPGGEGGAIAALDRETGAVTWTSAGLTDRTGYSSLIAVDLEGGGEPLRAIIGFTARAGVGVRAADGELLWHYREPANRTANAATPIYANGLVFYTSDYGTGGGALRLRVAGDNVSAAEAWFESRLRNHHGGVVLYEGHLYGFFGSVLACVDFETGETVWRDRSVGKGSLVLAEGKLFLLGERHLAGLAEATPEGYAELGRFDVDDRGRPSWAHPVVSNGVLYIRNWDELLAYDVSSP